jgi:putative transposase
MIAKSVSDKRHRFPPEIIARAVWLYFRFPLSLRLVEEMRLERGIVVSCETIRRWARTFGPDDAKRFRRKPARSDDIWHLDEVVITIAGRKHWLWRAVDQDGYVLDDIVQTRRNTKAAKRLLTRLLQKQGLKPKRLITDKLGSYGAATKAGHARRGAPFAQGLEQPGREQSRPFSKAGTDPAAFSIDGSPAAFRLRLFRRPQSLRPPRQKRSAPGIHLHRLQALAQWNSVAIAA